MIPRPWLTALACLTALLVPLAGEAKNKDGKKKHKKPKDGTEQAGDPAAQEQPPKDGKHKKKKDKGKHKNEEKGPGHQDHKKDPLQPLPEPALVGMTPPSAVATEGGPALSASHTGDAKASLPSVEAPLPGKGHETWCEWLRDKPGELYDRKDNPWIQSFEIGGRFHYQAAYVDGTDINGRRFHDRYDEYRRLRIETKTGFLRYFTAEINVNLVDDGRFREEPGDLDWGYDRFDEASLEFDLGKAFGSGPLDDIKLKYGRMKLKMTEEEHQSSNDILTIERSSLSDKLGGELSRPTGLTLELDKGPWDLTLGVFSGEDDTEFIGGWNDGRFYYASLGWKATDEFRLVADFAQNDQSGEDDALGYAWAGSLAGVYETKRWGVMVDGIYGNNGSALELRDRRQGDFYGVIAMPWYWVVKDRLQAVVQYQYARSDEEEGLRLGSRYLRGRHDDALVDVDNGRGDEQHSLYFGLNYHLCLERAKIMGGVQYEDIDTRNGSVHAWSYLIAFRASF